MERLHKLSSRLLLVLHRHSAVHLVRFTGRRLVMLQRDLLVQRGESLSSLQIVGLKLRKRTLILRHTTMAKLLFVRLHIS